MDKSDYIKENVRVEGFDGEAKISPLGKVWIDIGTSDFSKKLQWLKLAQMYKHVLLDALLEFERSTRTRSV